MNDPLASIELRPPQAQLALPPPQTPHALCSKKAMAVACPILCYGGVAFGAYATFKLGVSGVAGAATITAGVTLLGAVFGADKLNQWAGVEDAPGWAGYVGNLALAPLYAARHLWKGGTNMQVQALQPEEPV